MFRNVVVGVLGSLVAVSPGHAHIVSNESPVGDNTAGVSQAEPDASGGTVPLAFVENKGQWNTPARFVARGGPMIARFEENAIVLQLEERSRHEHRRGVVVRLAFEGAHENVAVVGQNRQVARMNYFVGRDRSQWRCDVPSYAQVLFRSMYDGIDVRMRDEAGRLKYDVLLSAGADLRQLVIRCEGVNALVLADDGSLVMETALGPIVQRPPVTWQEHPSGERVPVACHYCLVDDTSYGFEVPQQDPALALVIDPGLEWATYLGGGGNDVPLTVATDDVSVVVAGKTTGTTFPTTSGAYDTEGDDTFEDGFISKLSKDGTELLWSTYLGGDLGHDRIFDLTMDEAGVLTVVGQTLSVDFPTTDGAYDQSYSANGDAFIARLDPKAEGDLQLVWSTFLGGTLVDRAVAMDTETSGVVTVAGYTRSQSLGTPGAYDESLNGGLDVYVARLDPSQAGAAQLVWLTYLGGSADEGLDDFPVAINEDLMDIDVRASTRDVYVSGYTASSDFPTTPGAYDTIYNGGTADGFLSQLRNDGAELLWSTFLGGFDVNDDATICIAIDDITGEVTTAGLTRSADFPTTDGAVQTVHAGDADAFVSRLDPALSGDDQLRYSSFLGGPDFDAVIDMEVDSGVVTITGFGGSDFPTTSNAYDTDYNGGNQDGFVARLSLDGAGDEDLRYSTYIGDPRHGTALALALCGPDDVIVAGATSSLDFPVTDGAYDTTHNGGVDAWLARLDLCPIDLDDSGDVGITDLLALLAAWGPCDDCDDCPADFDGDCVVGITDLLLLLASWGPCL